LSYRPGCKKRFLIQNARRRKACSCVNVRRARPRLAGPRLQLQIDSGSFVLIRGQNR